MCTQFPGCTTIDDHPLLITGQELYSRISGRFKISESTTCDSTHIVLQTIHGFLTTKLIKWPTQDEQHEVNTMYEERHNFPGMKGFIDGTNTVIKPPEATAQDYYNRKDVYSVILQAVITEDM